MHRLLVVDDEYSVRESIKLILKNEYQILFASEGEEAVQCFEKEHPHLIILDILMPKMDGIQVLKKIREIDPILPVIMLTATKTVKTAVEAMKLGATDYITKPFDVEEISILIKRALEKQDLEREVKTLRWEVKKKFGFGNILVGKSPPMKEVCSKIEQIADTRTTVLITGESGTGKELIAKALHYNSSRRHKPFIAINCAAIPETLIESELFGHERGAFTDARVRRLGHFEMANSGTLFLDEIADLSPATQAKLLRVIQEKEFLRLGGTQTVKVDVRLIAATNKNLENAVKEKLFREDLYYRVNVVSLFLPPLRKRKEDLPPLIQHFLNKKAEEENKKPKRFSDSAMDLLLKHPWPGNVRELENIIEQVVTLTPEELITPENLPDKLNRQIRTNSLREETLSGNISFENALLEFEKDILLSALRKTNFVQTHAANLLGISRRILKYKMDTLGITPPDSQNPESNLSDLN
ncbi:MAG TPA: sigma-54 dependent transcriptional regulator [Nitrospiria bacterium]|jgi:DNA-binding NtrC family response regulator